MTEKSLVSRSIVQDETFQLLFEGHPVPMWIYDLKTLAFLEVNEAAREKYGYSRDEFLSLTLRDIRPAEDVKKLEADVRRRRPALQHSGHWRHKLKDGRIIDVEINSHIISFQGRQAVLVEARDITDKLLAEKQLNDLNRILLMVNQISDTLHKQHNQEIMLNEICRVAVETGGFLMAWVGLYDPFSRNIKPVASAGKTGSYLKKLNIVLDDSPQGQGPTAIALKSGKNMVIQNIASDELMAPWREAALRQGYRASAAFPLSTESGLAGTFNLYASEPGFFTPAIISSLNEISTEFALSIEFSRQEQKRLLTQAALQESEVRFRTIFEQAAVGVALVDSSSGRFLTVNRKMCELTGYSEKEILTKTFKDITHPDDLEMNLTFVRRFLAGEISTYAFEKRYLRKDGSILWVFTNIAALWKPGDKPGTHILVVEDISNLKKVEIALRQAEENYRSIFENASIGVFQSSLQGKFIRVNPFMAHLYGYESPDEMVALISDISRQIYVDPQKRLEFMRALDEKGWVDRFEVRELRKDGSIFWTSTSARAVKDSQGEISLIEGFVADITERKNTEQQLHKSQVLLADAEVIGGTGSWVDDIVTNTSTWSSNLFRIFGVDPKTNFIPTSKHFFEHLVHPEDRQSTEDAYNRSLAGEGDYDCEYRIVRQDGGIRKVHSIAQIQRDALGHPLHMIGWTQDITARWLEETSRRDTELRYHSLFENMLNGFAYCKMLFDGDKPVDFIYLIVNTAFENQTGLKNVTGRKVSQVIPGILELDPELIARYGRVSRSGQPEFFETFVESLDMWFSISVYSPHQDHFVAVFDVITERKKAEMKLQQAKDFAENLIQTANVIFVQLNLQGQVVRINTAAEQITGYSMAEMVGKPWFETLVPRERYPYVWEEFTHITQSAAVPRTFENPILTRSGQERIIVWQNSLLTEGESIIGTISFGMDITERRRVEEALQIEHDFSTQLTTVMGQGLTVTNSEGRFIFINPAYADLLGRSVQELTGKRPEDFTSAADQDTLRQATEIRSQGKSNTYETTLIRSDGKTVPVLITGVPRFQGDQVVGAIATVTDLSERKQTEDRLAEQVSELRRWQTATLGRENRVMDLKHEVNELLARLGQEPRYPSAEADDTIPSHQSDPNP